MSQNFSLRRSLGIRWTDTLEGGQTTREWAWLGMPLFRTRRPAGRSELDDRPGTLYGGHSPDLDDAEAVLGLTIGTLLLGVLVGLGGRWILSWGVSIPPRAERGVHTLAPPRGR